MHRLLPVGCSKTSLLQEEEKNHNDCSCKRPSSAIMHCLTVIYLCFHFFARFSTASSSPRIFVMSDISNEPDDQESLVRLLLHADQYTVEGFVTATSYWLNDTTYPDDVLGVVAAYENVTANLNVHSATGFPSAEYIRSKVADSHPVYGLAVLNTTTLSAGADLLISAVDASSEPLYILSWAGTSVLAEALHHVQRSRSSHDLTTFLGRLRVYTISDQDDAGPWIRRMFSSIPYIVSIHGFNMYGLAAWTGISGETYYGFDSGGPDTSLVSTSYIAKSFQRGILGAKYPDVAFVMEGDTPSLLSIMQNGLNVPEHPEYGGWGGRYTLSDISGHSRHYADTADTVIGQNNQTFVSNHATIWRWRSAYQNEMAARVQWSLTSMYSAGAHPPTVVVNNSHGTAPLVLSVAPEGVVVLDASASTNPDSNGTHLGLECEWMHYREITGTGSPNWNVAATTPKLEFECLDDDDGDGRCMRVRTVMPNRTVACGETSVCQSYHVILSVYGDGSETPLTRYKRVILDVIGV